MLKNRHFEEYFMQNERQIEFYRFRKILSLSLVFSMLSDLVLYVSAVGVIIKLVLKVQVTLFSLAVELDIWKLC